MPVGEKKHGSGYFLAILQTFVRFILVLSIISLLASSVLMLMGGFGNSVLYGIMVCSVYASLFIYYFTVPALLLLAVYFKAMKEKAWSKIKTEVLLLACSISSLLILGGINNYFVAN